MKVRNNWFWHVTTLKRLKKNERVGSMQPPVRAWKTSEKAIRFAKQTGRKIIIRIKIDDPKPLFGHENLAVYTNSPIYFDELKL